VFIETMIDPLMNNELARKKILVSSLFMVRLIIRSSLYLWYLVESGKKENFLQSTLTSRLISESDSSLSKNLARGNQLRRHFVKK
jgi:uncharacterized protein YxeA